MIKKTWYLKNSIYLDLAIEEIAEMIPCFITREFIEMDHSKIEIHFRTNDAGFIMSEMASLI